MKLITVLGARPQFIKAAMVSRYIKNESEIKEIIVHTGQHYDNNMSEIFFKELDIPTPKYNLGVGSASHGKQTARMLDGIEEVIINEKPDAVMVYGDTNSTLAGALAASKLHIQVIHVESGLRSFNKLMPEEQNRILTDHISTVLLCPTQNAVNNLIKEGIKDGVYNTGDVMFDSVIAHKKIAESRYSFRDVIINAKHYSGFESQKFKSVLMNLQKDEYYLATIHRAENTDNVNKLSIILNSFERLDRPVLFLVHPRTIRIIEKYFQNTAYSNIVFAQPVSYLEMLILSQNAKKIITDSGGLQKEAYFIKVPCVTLRDQTEWIETLDGKWNVLSKIDEKEIINNVTNVIPDINAMNNNYFGNGDASKEIVSIIKSSYIK